MKQGDDMFKEVKLEIREVTQKQKKVKFNFGR